MIRAAHGVRPVFYYSINLGAVALNDNENINREQQYAGCYRLLAACFYEPEKKLFLEEKLCETLFYLLGEICPSAAPYAEQMLTALKAASEEELAVEYARLFIGPFGTVAPPYGSVYLEKEATVMGKSTVATMQCYQDAGLALDEEIKEPADHIAIELEFLHYLSLQIAEDLDQGNKEEAIALQEARSDFLSRFPGQWAPTFCQKIRQGSKHPFYTALAACLETLLSQACLL